MKRIAIYFFYDADGVVDQYNDFLLRDLKQQCDRIVVVCNGKLTASGRKLFSMITQDIIVRENVGYDVWAYKTAMEWIGWDELKTYDELILLNFTNFAPIYSFHYVFDKMDQEDVDFWGMSLYHRVDPAPNWFQGSYLPEHLQSHFIAVRKKMLHSYEFRTYWETRPAITDYHSAVAQHEAIFTEHFIKKGFRCGVYAHTSINEIGNAYPALYSPVQMFEQYQYPLLKRRLFFHPYSSFFSWTLGYPASDSLQYVENKTSYSSDIIWQNILRACNQRDIYQTLHLNYILPLQEKTEQQNTANLKTSIAAILYLADINCWTRYASYLKNFPQGTDFYLICESQNISSLSVIQKIIGKPVEIEYSLTEQRSKTVFSLLKKLCDKYSYFAVLHFNGALTEESSREIGYECAETMVATSEYIAQIIHLFETNKWMGMLTMPALYWGKFWSYFGKESKDYTHELKKLSSSLHVPYDEKKPPVSPYYGVFWCKGAAIRGIKQICNEEIYKTVSEVPNRGLFQFWDSALGLMLQAAGFYCGTAMSDRYAALEFTNLSYQLSEINRSTNCSSIWELFGKLQKQQN